MARTRPSQSMITQRTFHFEQPNGGHARVDTRIADACEWYDSDESKDPAWHVTEADTPGRVLAVRLTVGMP